MIKHTPGPWQVGFDDGSGQDVLMIIAPAEEPHNCVVVQADGIEGNEANARLIAAAPLMLEALQAVEWIWLEDSPQPQPVCSQCRRHKADGHVDICTLAAAIKAAIKEGDNSED